ncbi:MAG: FAD-dependent oxidoreductase [Chloroflexota bacterium]|nr:FAD-dependent oxidoreductase [Chloroflexota bacterium]MDE2941517.1 FAD-dependent oxidoreductase [Chloroflexota bacterium]MDE3267736.1 FAD-dependent oxidoreductase [Chloroflexota bacterium]
MTRTQRIAIVGGGAAGMGAAWALHHSPDRFDFRVFEAKDRLGGNAVTVHMPQDGGGSIPFDIAATALIPSVYQHILLLMEQFGIELIPTRFSYVVRYGDGTYAHDFDSALRDELKDEIERFQRLLRLLRKVGVLTRAKSRLLNALNPFNYVSMGPVLDFAELSEAFRFKILKPMFINFVLATNVFDMPASLFARYLEFFDIEAATPMWTWDQGTQSIYDHLSAGFRDKVYLSRPVQRVHRHPDGVVVEDANGEREAFDQVIFACNANQALAVMDDAGPLERYILSSVRYDTELHREAIVHWDASVLPEDETQALKTRSNYIRQYGAKPDNYEVTYIMHNQQPWAGRSDKPCLVTYNPVSPIDSRKVIARHRFQHIVHDIRHVVWLVPLFRFIQGKQRTWHCGAHTLINSQETCLVSGLITARQLGADYPFSDDEARRWFNYYGSVMYGWGFRKAKG